MTLTVLVVDDQDLVRAGFRTLLDSDDGLRVIGEAADGRDAVEEARRLRPDVVVMDIRMPRVDGIEATERIVAESGSAGPKVLVLTTFDLDEYVFSALAAGASGFLLKDATRDELVAAVHVVGRGEALLSPGVTRRLIDEALATRRGRPGPEYDALTERERETLRLLAQGLSNAEVAREMYVGEATVKTHVGNVLVKLGVRDRVQAVIYAFQHGLA